MILARYRYAVTGFPMEYWDYAKWARPLIARLYRQAWVCRRYTTEEFARVCTKVGHCPFAGFASGECPKRRPPR